MSAYLLYRPVMDYEESMTPHMIFSTQKAGEEAVRKIQEWGKRVFETMPPRPEQSNTDDEYEDMMDAREKHIKDSCPAPFDWNFSSDLSNWSDRFDTSCVGLLELPLNPKLDTTTVEGLAS